MENYLNHIDNTNDSLNNDHKLSFINAITLDTFSNIEKNITKYPKTPPKSKSSKSILYFRKNTIDKEIISDIDSTRYISEKNISKNIFSKKDLKNEDDNNKYIIVKNSTNELSTLKTENKPNIKIRRDIFGTEIKKGGKQRISFADNVHILKSRKKFEDEGFWLYGNRYRQYVDLSNINNNNKMPKIRGLKRSLIGLKNDKLKKRYDIGNSDKKILSLVEVIKIENYKELNKMSNFGIPKENENIKETQDTVCCSGTCFIY